MLEANKTKKETVIDYFNNIASKRDKYIRKNWYYYKSLTQFLQYNIPVNSSILEVGCGTGHLLNQLQPSKGVGIDISPKMIEVASKKYPSLTFIQADAETLNLSETFDYIIISDTLGYFVDIQQMFRQLQHVCHNNTRIIITYHHFLWTPLTALAEILHLKMPGMRLNWLNSNDIGNLLELENFDIIRKGKRLLFPKYVPIISWFCNKYLAHLPLINHLCLNGYIIAKPLTKPDASQLSVSVVIPTRNEQGNIEEAIQRTPMMGKSTEIIFVEGGSTDDTWSEIHRIAEKYKTTHDIKYIQQTGKGKGDAVRQGYSIATGDVLMILDADLTVPPEDLPKFFNAIATGKGEYINGTRLVYPMEKDAMRTLNMMGNKFFSIMFSWILSQRIKDTLCGTKVMTKNNWNRIQANRHYFGEFDPFGDFDMIFGAAKLNLKFIEVPIRYQARTYGDTNISRFKHGWLLIKMMFFSMNKIKFK